MVNRDRDVSTHFLCDRRSVHPQGCMAIQDSQSHLETLHKHCVCVISLVQLFATPWTVACQMPLSMEFSISYFPNPGIKLVSLASPALADRFFITTQSLCLAEVVLSVTTAVASLLSFSVFLEFSFVNRLSETF